MLYLLRLRLSCGLSILALALAPGLAPGGDGSREISQACALQGCFANDAAGFPVEIDEPGSYVLTSNLVVPSASDTAIILGASDVSIDLNRFAIVRAGCEGSVVDCTPPDTPGFGVIGSTMAGVSVHNGTVTGMGRTGILLGPQAHVSDVRARWNGSTGIAVGEGSVVRSSAARENGNQGILAGTGSTVTGNVASGNGGNGIDVRLGVTVIQNTSLQNGGAGIAALPGCTIADSTTHGNGGNGIQCIERCVIRSNTVRESGAAGISTGFQSVVRDNVVVQSTAHGILASTSSVVIGNTSNSNGGDGIQTGNASTIVNNSADSNTGGGDGIDAGDGSSVRGNTARSNQGFGLRAESTLVGFGDNVFGNNNAAAGTGDQTSSGTDLGGNLCDTSTVCP